MLVEGYQAIDGAFRANGRDVDVPPTGTRLFAGSSGTGAPRDGRDPDRAGVAIELHGSFGSPRGRAGLGGLFLCRRRAFFANRLRTVIRYVNEASRKRRPHPTSEWPELLRVLGPASARSSPGYSHGQSSPLSIRTPARHRATSLFVSTRWL